MKEFQSQLTLFHCLNLIDSLRKSIHVGLIFYYLVLSADNFRNSLEPDQTRQKKWPDFDPNYFVFYKKVDF